MPAYVARDERRLQRALVRGCTHEIDQLSETADNRLASQQLAPMALIHPETEADTVVMGSCCS
jgi:hypothetical protein